MPCRRSGGSLSLHTYQSRYGESGLLRGGLEPGMLVRCVVDDQVENDADAALLGLSVSSAKSPRVPRRGSTP